MGVEKLLRIDLDATQGLVSFVRQVLDRLPEGVPAPHGLAADKDENIWFTASFQEYIGKLDPKTGTNTEYHLPDPAARDPHTPVFDRTLVLWFTVQRANMVGRLVPQTGVMKLQRVPTP